MIKVSKEAFDEFFSSNIELLNRTPSFSEGESSVTWLYEFNNKKACKFVEVGCNACEFYVTDNERGD